MPLFVIERNIPGADKLTKDELRGISAKSCEVVAGLGVPYTWLTSYVAGDKIYCVHEAESAADMGLTPHAYLTQVRIDRSRQLLQRSTSISQIALDVGFADQAHFTKRFKQLTGTTPAHYAKSIQ